MTLDPTTRAAILARLRDLAPACAEPSRRVFDTCSCAIGIEQSIAAIEEMQ